MGHLPRPHWLQLQQATAALSILAILAGFLTSVPTVQAAAGIYQPISYQGKVALTNGTAVANGTYNMQFKIFSAASGGSPVWTETWDSGNRVTMTGGLFSVQLGSITAMTAVDFNSDSLYLQVEFDPGNDGTYEEVFSPRRRFASVPYAHNADMLDGLDSTKFVRKDQAETMSGTLTVKPNNSASIGLNIISTAGSNTVPGLKISTQGANHILFGSGGANYDVNLYRFTANVLKTDDSFYAAGTLSGTTIKSDGLLAASGALAVEGASFLQGAVTFGSTVKLGGVTYTFPTGDGSASGKVLKTNAAGQLSWSTDQTGTSNFGTGNVVTIGDARYVKKAGDTMSGALVIKVGSNGSSITADAGVAFEVIGTASGRTLRATDVLVSSGTLLVEGNTFLQSGVTMTALPSCTNLQTSVGGALSCNNTAYLATSTGALRTAFDSRYVNVSGDTMTGALGIRSGNGSVAVDAGVLLEVLGTMSGRTLFATDALTSSGALTVEGTSILQGTVRAASGIVISRAEDSEFLALRDTTNSRQVGLRTGSGTPRGIVTASLGSLYLDNGSGKLYRNTDGSTGWVELASGSGSLHQAKMRRDGAQSIPDATLTKIAFDAEEFDLGGIADPDANDRFDIRHAGRYLVSASWNHTGGSATNTQVSIYKNGAEVATNASETVNNARVTDVLDLVQGDYLEMYVYQNNGTAVNTDTSDRLRPRMAVVEIADDAGSGLWTLSGANLFNDNLSGNVGIGVTTPGSRLSVSGSVVISADGNLRATSADPGLALEILGTASGRVLHAQDTLSSSGALSVAGNMKIDGGTLFADATLNRVGVGTLTPDATLEVLGTSSGTFIHASNQLTSSGTLSIQGNARFKSTVTLNGVTYTFPTGDGSASGKVLATDGAGHLSWTTAAAVSNFGSGNVLTLGDQRYLRDNGDTMSGALVIKIGSKGTLTADSNVALEVIGTMSGQTVHAESTLTSSGTLKVNGAATFGSTMKIGGVIYTFPAGDGSATGRVLATDAAGHLSWTSLSGVTGISQTQADTNYVNIGGDTMTGALTILKRPGTATGNTLIVDTKGLVYDATNKRIGIGTAAPRATLEVAGSMSGNSLQVSNLRNCSTLTTDVNGNLSCGGMVTKTTTTNQTSANSTQFLQLPTFNVGASEQWIYEYQLITQSPSVTPQWKFSIWAPSGSTCKMTAVTATTASVQSQTNVNVCGAIGGPTSTGSIASAAVGRQVITIFGSILSSSTTGSGGVRWSEKATSGTEGVMSGSTLKAFKAVGSDVAEVYQSKDASILPGMVVSIDSSLAAGVKKSHGAYDNQVLGIVSTKPGMTIGGDDLANSGGFPVYVALAGRVPVMVTSENGPIEPGDFLTPGTMSGTAMKATRAGAPVIAQAMTAFAGEGLGVVTAFVKNSVLQGSPIFDLLSSSGSDLSGTGGLTGTLNADGTVTAGLVGAPPSDATILRQYINSEVHRQIAAANLTGSLRGLISHQSGAVASGTGASIPASTGTLDFLQVAGDGTVSGSLLVGSTLDANAIVSQTTLQVAGDASIGGDLYLDGMLKAKNLFIPGTLKIDGQLQANTLDTQTLHAASASIDGTLTINGNLDLQGGLTLGSGASLTLSDLTVRNALMILGDVTIEGLATFQGDVRIQGQLIVDDRQAGYAEIPRGGTGVTIRFASGFTSQPLVTASADRPVLYGVSKATMTGFTIRLMNPAEDTVTFTWMVLVTDHPLITQGESGQMTVTIALQSFLVDSAGVPISSNGAWNACIRNETMLDADGHPLSCARYHVDHTWEHPDLHVQFGWNTNMTPPLLTLPDGYEAVVQGGAASSSVLPDTGSGTTETSSDSSPASLDETEGALSSSKFDSNDFSSSGTEADTSAPALTEPSLEMASEDASDSTLSSANP